MGMEILFPPLQKEAMKHKLAALDALIFTPTPQIDDLKFPSSPFKY